MSLTNSRKKYYWDACIWITLISDRHSSRGQACEYVLEQAQHGNCTIWTSSFCLAEVFKRKCDGDFVTLAEEHDTYFEDLIEQEFIQKVSVDVDVGKVARRLLRRHPKIGKPQDAIHVASCLIYNLDQLHTFDDEDLLALDGELERVDKNKLTICEPPKRPENPQMKMFEDHETEEKPAANVNEDE